MQKDQLGGKSLNDGGVDSAGRVGMKRKKSKSIYKVKPGRLRSELDIGEKKRKVPRKTRFCLYH